VNVFRDKDKHGKPRGRWRVEFLGPREIRRRVTGFSDRKLSEALGRAIERLVACKAAGEPLGAELQRWLEGIPKTVRSRLAEFGLVDLRQEERRVTAALPLGALLARWGETLRGRGRTEKHVGLCSQRARALFRAADARTLEDLDPERVERALRELCEREGLGAASSNHYLTAARGFSRWAWQSRLLAEDPLRGLKVLNARTDRRHERRALSAEEARALLSATAQAPERFGLDGRTRALFYLLAIETAFRASELRSLRVSSFELFDPERATVRVDAAYSKHRREDVQPLRPELAQELAALFRDRLPAAPAFPLPKAWRSAAMLREDLEAAGIAYEDESGRVLDFHALRVTTATMGVRAGMPPAALQRLMRHSTPSLTFGVYAKLGRDDTRAAVAMLPDLTWSRTSEAQRATGTGDTLDPCGGSAGVIRGQGAARSTHPMHGGARQTPAEAPRSAVAGAPGRTRTSDPRIRNPMLCPAELRALGRGRGGVGEMGLEPTTRSTQSCASTN